MVISIIIGTFHLIRVILLSFIGGDIRTMSSLLYRRRIRLIIVNMVVILASCKRRLFTRKKKTLITRMDVIPFRPLDLIP